MPTQVFKKKIPNEILFTLLDSICVKNEKHYMVNVEAFKRGVFKELFPNFINNCTPFYHLSKRCYLEKKFTYKSFTTILRQICNCNQILYTSKITFDKSTYGIVYYIFH